MIFSKFAEAIILSGCLGRIAWMDWKYRRIPNNMLISLLMLKNLRILWECVFCTEAGRKMLLTGSRGFVLGGGILLVCRLLFREGIGAGDVKLFAVLGFWLGSRRIVLISCLTVLLAAVCSVVLLVFRKIDLKQSLPLAPFVLAGAAGMFYMEWFFTQ